MAPLPDRSVVYSFIGNFSSLNAGLTTAGRNVNELGTKLTALDRDGARMRAGLDEVGRSAGRIGLVAAGGLALATKAAIDWESQWAGVMKTVEGTAAQMDALEGSLRELARTMPATHEEIAATAEAAGQLGVAREDIVDFTKVMIELGETTDLTADTAATSIAQFMNVLGTTGDQVDEIGNTLVALGNKGASTESQILAMAQRLSGVGTTVGATESDILGLASAMANLGIEADLGGGAVQRVMIGINTQVLSSGEKLDDFAQLAGMSAEEFAQAWQDSPVEAFDAVLRGLGGVSAAGGDVASVLSDLGIKGTQNLQVMLRLAGAGDELTNSLGQSNEAWEENSALTEEYGKRAETTAAEVQVAWNNIKDAAIEVGAVVLPILGDVAEATSTVAQGFGSLPGPVKSATAGLLGITAVLGGGLWFTSKVVGGIANTKQALGDLGVQAGTTRTALSNIGKAAVGIGAVVVTADLLQAAFSKLADTRLDSSNLVRDLEALADDRLTDNLDDLFQTFQDIDDGWQPKSNPISWISSWDPSGFEDAQKNIEDLDQAFASLVESGNAETAAAAFENLGPTAEKAGVSTEKLAELFPEYQTALDNAAASAAEAAEANEDLAGGITAAEKAALKSAAQQEKLAEKLAGQRKAAREAAQGFLGLGDSLDNSKKSLGQWLRELEKQAQALRDFTKNAQTAAKKGLDDGLIKSLNEAGPAGALRMKQLANATDAEIKRANRAWRAGQAAIREYVNMQVPAKDVQVNNRQALAAIAIIQARLASLHSKTIAIDIATGQRRAAGGPIYGPGTKTSDSVPVMASRGEFMMSAAAVDHYGVDTMFAMNARHLAAGGSVSAYAKVGAGGTPNWPDIDGPSAAVANMLDHLGQLGEKQVKRLERQYDRAETLAEKSLEQAKERLDEERGALKDLRDARREFMQSVTSNFRSDVFGDVDLTQAALGGQLGAAFSQGLAQWLQASGTSLDIGMSQADQSQLIQQYLDTLSSSQLAALQAQASVGQLGVDSQNAETFERVLEQLRELGLRGGAYQELAASGNLAQAQAYLQMGPDFVRTLMQEFRQRDRALQNLGQSVGNAQFGADIREQLHVSRQAARAVEESRDALRTIEKAQKDIANRLDRIEKNSPKETGAATAAAMNGSVGHGQRKG